MPKPHLKLAGAYEEERRVTVTETSGTVYEDVVLKDFTHFETADVEVREVNLRGRPYPLGLRLGSTPLSHELI